MNVTKIDKTTQPDALDLRIFELSMQNPSLTDQEIGNLVGLSRGAVVKRKQKDKYLELLKTANLNIIQRLTLLSGKAVEVIGELMDDPDSRVRLSASVQVLKLIADHSAVVEQKKDIVIDLTWAD